MNVIVGDSAVFPIVESSQVGEARRAADRFAQQIGFDETRRGQASIIATELGTNLARHAKSGELVLRIIDGTVPGIEFLSIDRGPGIASFNDAMRDGYTTGTTAGTGLGAVKRLSSGFEFYTSMQSGTVLLSRLYLSEEAIKPQGPEVGAVCLPKQGQSACGDSWFVEQPEAGRTMAIVADGLGHGLLAAEASRQAVRLFRENLHLSTAQIMQLLHDGLRSTRGAAVAVAELKPAEKVLRFTAVGNIAASIHDGLNSRSLLSQNGTVGAEARRIQEMTYPWADGSLLLMHSDGLSTQWQLSKYAGLRFKHPSLIASVLYRDYRRERDDATVIAVRTGGEIQ